LVISPLIPIQDNELNTDDLMKAAEKLTIPKSRLAIIQDLADAALNSRHLEGQLQQAISRLPDLQKAELLALTTLGRGGSHTACHLPPPIGTPPHGS